MELAPGVSKFVHAWLPSSPPLAVVCVIHGLGEHGGRYRALGRSLAEEGLAVYAFDQQGHGRSPEPRGCIASYESLLRDVEVFHLWVRQQFDDTASIMLGHSMGGNLVLNYALRDYPQPTALISSSPMIRAVRAPGYAVEQLARLFMAIAPNYRLRSHVVIERLMRDPEEQRALREDEFFHSQLSLRLGAALIDTGRWALCNAPRLRTPTLLTHGTHDYLTSTDASREFARLAGGACRLEICEGALHDPFRDLDRQQVISTFLQFIRAHGARKSL